HASVDRVRIEIDRFLVRVDRLVVETFLSVVDLAQAHVYAWVDRVVDEGLLVRGNRAIDVALRGFGVAEPDVRIRVEWAELDRFAVRLDRLIEEPPRLRQIEIAERLIRLRIERIELRRGAKLCGRFPS